MKKLITNTSIMIIININIITISVFEDRLNIE